MTLDLTDDGRDLMNHTIYLPIHHHRPTAKKQFAMMDKDGNGTLTYDELHESLLSMPGLQSIPRCVRGWYRVGTKGASGTADPRTDGRSD